MNKYAIIDIGTNSTRLLIASVEKKEIVARQKYLITTRMGKGVDHNKVIQADAMKRNLEALKEFKKIIESSQVDQVIIFGTSALRDAKNGAQFVRLAQEELQMSVVIIDGKLEAEYAFLGVTEQYKQENIVIMDIGGGSTELVYACKGKLVNSDSLNIGSVRLTERFIKNDPPLLSEQNNIKGYIQDLLQEKIQKQKEDFNLVGIGGTASTLASIKLSLREYSPEKVHRSKVFKGEVDNIIHQLLSMKDVQRKEMIGLNPNRSDIISAGAMILQALLSFYNKDYFLVSDYDNLEGALYYYLKK